MITQKKVAYYLNSEIRITNPKHPHFNAIGDVVRAKHTTIGFGLVVKRHDTQETFLVFNPEDIKITKRK